jgi:hypothetical protein
MSSIAHARRSRSRRSPLPALVCLSALAAAGWTILNRSHDGGPEAAPPLQASAQPPRPTPSPRPEFAWMFEPAPLLRGTSSANFSHALPVLALNAAPQPPAVAAIPVPVPATLAASPATATVAAASPAAPPPPVRVASADPTLVPLPVSRPANLLAAAPQPIPSARLAARQTQPRTRDVFRAAIAEEPSFFDRLFGGGTPSGNAQALAYANPDAVASPRPRLGPAVSANPSEGVAVYDISAGSVTLPNGEVLEAHSGYGDLMDDPRYVHVRMRGSTPPGTYDLRERERPFHGVRAIRLTPVGGSAAIHGRDGILAHTYMLRRQPGASNGCVVFRDYDRFLRAYLRGEVRRLIVVAGNRGSRLDMAGR